MVYLIQDGVWYGVEYVEGRLTWKNRNIVKRLTESAFIALGIEERLKDKGIKIDLGQPIHPNK